MHTSYGNTIPLSSSPEEIREKVWGMVTDPARIHPCDPGHPEVCPVNAYHLALEREAAEAVAEACRRGEISCVEHKQRMAAFLVERLEPHRRIREEVAGREEELWDILRQGSQRASALARATLEEVRSRMGLPHLRREKVGRPEGNRPLDLTGMLCC